MITGYFVEIFLNMSQNGMHHFLYSTNFTQLPSPFFKIKHLPSSNNSFLGIIEEYVFFRIFLMIVQSCVEGSAAYNSWILQKISGLYGRLML